MADTSSLTSTNAIPTFITSGKVYKDGDNLIGVANVELPSLEYMTETMSCFGIAGELDMPVAGHVKSTTVKLSWNTLTVDAASLLATEAHYLDIRGDIQEYDGGTGQIQHKARKCVLKAMPKTGGLGKIEPGKKMDNETELEVLYLKLWIGGTERLEFDKINFIFTVGGTDLLSTVRSNLGM